MNPFILKIKRKGLSMNTRIKHKSDEINTQKKNVTGEACFLPFNGEAVKYSEAKPSVASDFFLAETELLSSFGNAERISDSRFINLISRKKTVAPRLNKTSGASLDKIELVKVQRAIALSGVREFSKLEARQRKIIHHEYEKEEKRLKINAIKSIKQKRMTPLVPYYQIQTCNNNNSHFARTIVLCSCNDHINCGVCRLKRMIRLQKKYLPVVSEFKNAKMLTLTMKRVHSDLKVDLERLNHCLSRFKKTKTWKEKVSNYFGSKEVVENNVHAHIIIDSKYWTQKDISELWFEITGTDYIVDIRKLKNPNKAIKEVFKYIVKDAKKELLAEVSKFRKNNPHFRWVFSSKGLSKLVEDEFECEALNEAEILNALEGGDTSLDTIAISGRQKCPCCSGDLIMLGDFKTKEEAEAEVVRILKGNQYRRPHRP
jgi:hypothetical protein